MWEDKSHPLGGFCPLNQWRGQVDLLMCKAGFASEERQVGRDGAFTLPLMSFLFVPPLCKLTGHKQGYVAFFWSIFPFYVILWRKFFLRVFLRIPALPWTYYVTQSALEPYMLLSQHTHARVTVNQVVQFLSFIYKEQYEETPFGCFMQLFTHSLMKYIV